VSARSPSGQPFGGSDASEFRGDTWSFDGKAWKKLAPDADGKQLRARRTGVRAATGYRMVLEPPR